MSSKLIAALALSVLFAGSAALAQATGGSPGHRHVLEHKRHHHPPPPPPRHHRHHHDVSSGHPSGRRMH